MKRKYKLKLMEKMKRLGVKPQEIVTDISSDIRLRIKLYREYGKGKIFQFVCQLESLVNGKWKQVVRYDNYHSVFHRNLLNIEGKIVDYKEFKSHSIKEDIEKSKKDLKDNYESYIRKFRGG